MRKALRRVAGAAAHEALVGSLVAADVARLAFRFLRAFLGRNRDSLLVFLFGMVSFGATAALYPLTQILVTTLFLVLLLARRAAVACLAAAALFGKCREWRGAEGAICEEHGCDRVVCVPDLAESELYGSVLRVLCALPPGPARYLTL